MKKEKMNKTDNLSGTIGLPEKKNNKSEEKPVSMANVMFRENRKFDLHVGRKMVTFKGRETKKIPVAWLQHKDFQSVEKYFVVKGA